MIPINNVKRRELKFYVPKNQVQIISDYLSLVLIEDSNSQNGRYTISSLYFDSINDEDFIEKLDGIMFREKYRVRIYNFDLSFGKFEIKRKLNNCIEKFSMSLNASEMEDVISGNMYKVLETNSETEYVSKKMQYKLYSPKSIVTYDRKAFYLPLNNIRITLDMNLRNHGFETNMNMITNLNSNKILQNDFEILEVKFSGELPSFIEVFLREFKLINSSISKYALSRIDNNTEIYGDDPIVPF